jgi:hypothetical protein
MEMVAMMSGYADDRAWWQAGLMCIAMTVFWGLLAWASYSLSTGVTRRSGPWTRDAEHRRGDARRIPDERLARGEPGTGAVTA